MPPKATTRICSYFQTGSCKFGDKCRFLHEKKAETKSTPANLVAADDDVASITHEGREEFEVWVNPEFGGQDMDSFAEAFAGWAPEEEASRSFTPSDIRALLASLEQDSSRAEIVGFQEFPYSHGGKLKGPDREVEREYWAALDRMGRRLMGDDKLAIFHVHYAGKWHPVPDMRDRTVIKQINVRHTTKIRNKAFHIKCKDLNKWREKHGSSVLTGLPVDGWKWEQQPELSPTMHRLLKKAERCSRKVRSLDMNRIPGLDIDNYSRKALIWCVQKYDSEKVQNLPNAAHDGAGLESLLLKFGWDVEFLKDVKLEELKESLSDFIEKVQENDEACMVAFIGHGIEFKGQNYFVPRDAKLAEKNYRGNERLFEEDLKQMCLSFSFVEDMVADVRNGKNNPAPSLFLLDCCRDGSIVNAGGTSRGIELGADEAKPVRSSVKNSCVIFSTTSGKTAADGRAGEGGPFMNAFTQSANKPGESLEDILMKTRAEVEENTSRGGNCQLAPHISLLKEKFYFCPPLSQSSPTVPESPFSAPAPESPFSPGSRQSWGSSAENQIASMTDAHAQDFWKACFFDADQVEWRVFAAALADEIPCVQDAGNLAKIRDKLDASNEGRVTLMMFNIFTRKLGLEGACHKAAGLEEAAATTVSRQKSSLSMVKKGAIQRKAAHAADSDAHADGRSAELDEEIMQMLQEWDLQDAANALARARYTSLRRLRKMEVDDVDKLGLPLATAQELRDLVVSLKNEQGALAFADRRQEWCNMLIHDMNVDTEAVRRQLSNITPQIEACDLTEPGLPRRLRDKIQLIHMQDGCRGLLQRFNMAVEVKAAVVAAMAGVRKGIQEEEDTDNKLRAQFGTRWTRATSASLNGILKQEAADIEKNLVLAAQADQKVEAKISENRELLDMLGYSIEQLDAQVAGVADKAYDVLGAGSAMDQMKTVVVGLKELVLKIEMVLAQREQILAALFKRRDAEDPIRALSHQVLQGKTQEEATAALLGEYAPIRDAFDQNRKAVHEFLLQLQQGNASFVSGAQQDAEMQRREGVLKKILLGLDAYELISSYVREGTNYYAVIQEKVDKLKMRAEDFKMARDFQKEELMELRAVAKALLLSPNDEIQADAASALLTLNAIENALIATADLAANPPQHPTALKLEPDPLPEAPDPDVFCHALDSGARAAPPPPLSTSSRQTSFSSPAGGDSLSSREGREGREGGQRCWVQDSHDDDGVHL